MSSDILEVLITEEEIREKVARLGEEIENDYRGKDLVAICILKGAAVFTMDLIRSINLPLTIDFMSVSSYGNTTKSSGVVKIVKDLDMDVSNKDLLIVEDIVDSGLTLSYIMEVMRGRGAKSVSLCTILDKPEGRKKDVHISYRGFTIPNEFVVGYGLDYAEKYRNLPYVGILKPEIYTK